MPRKRSSHYRPVELNRDHARSRSVPAPSNAQFNAHLDLLLHPIVFGMRDRYRGAHKRERILSLPVMVGMLLSLVWRQIASVRELQRVLARESLVWVEPTIVSQQAIAKRLTTLPASLFAQVWQDLEPVLQQRAARRPGFHPELMASLAPCYERIWVLDSSRLEAIFKQSKAVRDTKGTVLGGTLTAVLDLASHLPVRVWVEPSATVNDHGIVSTVLETLPNRTIVLLDRGFTSFALFDQLAGQERVLISPWGTTWAFDELAVVRATPTLSDQVVELGKYRSNPCRSPVRRIGRRTAKGSWDYWITTELDAQRLPAEQVIALYAQRWRIEDAFLQCKRLLGLSYLWGSTENAIALQVWTTLLLYGVLVDLCGEAAVALQVAAERISLEMLYRSLYHSAGQIEQGEQRPFITWLTDPVQRDLGIVKRLRKPVAQISTETEAA